MKMALPPAVGGAFPDLPRCICHSDLSSERWILIAGEDIREHDLKVTSLVINHYFLGWSEKVTLPSLSNGRLPDILPDYKTQMPLCPCRVTYVSQTDIQNGGPVYLTKNFSGLDVALCELTYYHQWHNSAALKNNQKKVKKLSETDSIKSQISSKTYSGKKGQHKKTPSKTSPETARFIAISNTGGHRLV